MRRLALPFRGDVILSAGILAGLSFALFEMIAAALVQGPNFFFMPLRMIGAIVLGPSALEPTASLVVAAVTGTLVHMLLSITFASLFAAMVSRDWSFGSLAVGGMLFGFSLWILNFYVVAPLAGWLWFVQDSNPVVQFIAHVFFFGYTVGWVLSRSRLELTV
jgi:hypothetical protein